MLRVQTLFDFLETHLQNKLANQSWLYDCLEGDIAAFPHRVCEKGVGSILDGALYYPKDQPACVLPSSESSLPSFIVNIPEGLSSSGCRYHTILDRISKQSFGATSVDSSAEARLQVAVVVGTNQVESLDAAANRAFKDLIENTAPVDSIYPSRSKSTQSGLN